MVRIAGPGIIEVATALAHDELVLTRPEMKLVLFLASTRGHQWRTQGGKRDLDSVAESLHLPPSTLDRAIQHLKLLEVIEVERPNQYRAVYRLTDLFLARCEVVVEERFLGTRRGLTDEAAGGLTSEAAVASPVGLHREETQGEVQENFPPGGRAASGRTDQSVRMATDNDLDREFHGAPKKGQPRGVSGRVRAEFYRMFGEHRPVVSSAAKMGANIKWLIDQGYTEEVILESFKIFKGMLPSLAIGPHLACWDAYFQKRGPLMKQAAFARMGGRGDGGKTSDQLAADAIERQSRRKERDGSVRHEG